MSDEVKDEIGLRRALLATIDLLQRPCEPPLCVYYEGRKYLLNDDSEYEDQGPLHG